MQANRSYRLLLFICLLGILSGTNKCYTQIDSGVIEISGIINDSISKLPLEGVSIFSEKTNRRTITDHNGYYKIILVSSDSAIKISYVGYKNQFIHFSPTKQSINIKLVPESYKLNEVDITANSLQNQLQNIQSGKIQLNRKQVANLPMLLGESDFYKTLQLMPGVQASGEGNAAIYIRGGGFDQNLILLDGATVYNPTHLLGFFSVFNSDIINDVTMFKSGIPAEYGNRLSSVLDFSTKQTVPNSIKVNGSIGLLTSRLNIDVPLFKNKAALFVAARRTYIDLLMEGFRKAHLIKRSSILYKTGYDFYDLNASLVFNLSPKNKLQLSSYKGNDWFSLNSGVIDLHTNMNWGNKIASLTWNHIFNSKCYMDFHSTYSQYDLTMDLDQNRYSFKMLSGINDYGLKDRITWFGDKHKVILGVEALKHDISPNASQANSDSLKLNFGAVNTYKSYELSGYFSDEFKLTSKLGIIAGLRYSTFFHIGSFDDLLRDPSGNIYDTIHYKPNQIVKNFNGIDIRLSTRYLINSSTSLKISVNTNNQYIHLANASTVTFPTDFWIPSTNLINPQHGVQWAAGIIKLINNQQIETSIDLYYKTFKNQIEFFNGIFNSLDNISLDENLIFGKGRAYGAEIFFRKPQGKLTGWIGYTLSRTEKKFDEIENGQWFPARYDRPHDISIVVNYKFNHLFTFSAVFVYASGNSYTPVIGRYFVEQNVINQYGKYNSARMPAYHRLDISATYDLSEGHKLKSKVILSIINVYNRKNAYFIYPEATGDLSKYNLTVEPKVVSIFPILPSITWEFSF